MSQVTIQLNGKPYVVGCEDGQEQHLANLAARYDQQVRQVSQSVGQLGETRLFMMAGLLMADELNDIQAQLAETRAEVARLRSAGSSVEDRAANALDAAARRIEALAAKVGEGA